MILGLFGVIQKAMEQQCKVLGLCYDRMTLSEQLHNVHKVFPCLYDHAQKKDKHFKRSYSSIKKTMFFQPEVVEDDGTVL